MQRYVRLCAATQRTFSKQSTHDNVWGVKYDDECLKFEKEWQAIAEETDKAQHAFLASELSDQQKAKVDMLADKCLDLNIFEMRYMAISIKERVQRTSGINPLKLNMDWPSIKMDADGTWPPLNPNWFKQQELMSQLGPMMGAMGGGMGGGGAPAQAAATEEKVEKVEEKEKTHYDVELSSFDAASKIKVIKEIRAIKGLGLKEAKELVEASP